jgi:hypothetical protein
MTTIEKPYEITHWYSTIGTGDGHDYATRGYLSSLMKIGYEGLRLPPSVSSAMLVFDKAKDADIARFTDLVRPPAQLRMSDKKGEDGAFVQTTENVNWLVKALVLHHDPASICRVYSHLTRMDRAPGVAYVGITVWETSAIPESVARVLSELDTLIVPSQHTRDAFVQSGVDTNLHVVPHTFDPEIWPRPGKEELRESVNNGRFVFYAIATPIERKNLYGLLRAYFDAFKGQDDVVLRIKTMGDTKDLLKRVDADCFVPAEKRPKVQFFVDRWPTEKIRAFHLDGDCCVSACKGEGFGLIEFEGKLCGNRVITTDWGAAPEFLLTTDLLVQATLEPVHDMHGIGPYDDTQQWANPDHDALVAAMRQAYEEKRPRDAAQWDYYRNSYGPEAIGRQLADILVRAKESA